MSAAVLTAPVERVTTSYPMAAWEYMTRDELDARIALLALSVTAHYYFGKVADGSDRYRILVEGW